MRLGISPNDGLHGLPTDSMKLPSYLLATLTLLSTSFAQQTYRIRDLQVQGVGSRATVISGNGQAVAGTWTDPATFWISRSFRWTSLGGLVDLDPTVGLSSFPVAISWNGNVVAGVSDYVAFRWTPIGLKEGLETPGLSSPTDVSADGLTVVGWAAQGGPTPGNRGFRWTEIGGFEDLETLGGSTSVARSTTATGNLVVGESEAASGHDVAFGWAIGGVMVPFGTLGGNTSDAVQVARSGGAVVGQAETANGDVHAFRWTAGSGMRDLGTLGGTHSSAVAVSADGLVVAGDSTLVSGQAQAFRWTSAGIEPLGPLGSNSSTVRAISADGSVIVGVARISGFDRAFAWTESGGFQNLGWQQQRSPRDLG